MYRIGIDLGGTKTEGVLLDESLAILKRKRVSTPKDNYTEILDVIASLTNEMSEGAEHISIGVCTPGSISKVTGLIQSSNIWCLLDKPLKEDLEERLGQNISLENDANCFAVAEATMGSAINFSFVFGVIMGTGVGGGIVIDGKLHHGRLGIAGEWGHHTLHPYGRDCYCGRLGCVETYISGMALQRRWSEMTRKAQTMPEIVQNLDSKVGIQFKKDWLEDFGMGLANVINILDPDVVVLGGGLSNVDFLYTDGQKSVHDKIFSSSANTPILKNKLGDSAGVFGAALL